MAKRTVESIACNITYPVSRADLIDRYGECTVRFSNGDVQHLRNLMSGYEIDVFDSYGNLVEILEI